MKMKEVGTKCPCGYTLSFRVKKPNSVTPTVIKHECHQCGSLFLVKCSKQNGEFRLAFELQDISQMARDFVQWRIENGPRTFPPPRGLKGLAAWITQKFRV